MYHGPRVPFLTLLRAAGRISAMKNWRAWQALAVFTGLLAGALPARAQSSVAVVPVGALPRGVAILGGSPGIAVVANSAENSVSLVDLTTERVIDRIANISS